MKFSALPAVNDWGGFWNYEVPKSSVEKDGACKGIVGRALHHRRAGSKVLQLSVDGQTGQMGQTGSDEMEWAILSRILTSRTRGLISPCCRGK